MSEWVIMCKKCRRIARISHDYREHGRSDDECEQCTPKETLT